MCRLLLRLHLGVFAGGLRRCSPAFVGPSIVAVFRCCCRSINDDVFAGAAVTYLVLLAAEAGNLHRLVAVLISACF